MKVRNEEEKITFEVEVKEGRVNCILRNFYPSGADFPIDENFTTPLDEELANASDEEILKSNWNDRITFMAQSLLMDADQIAGGDAGKKEQVLAIAETLKNMDYARVNKKLIRF